MQRAFSELVIEGPFILVKGFLMGFWSTQEPPPQYFFHRKAGIRRETLRDALVELFELENMVHVCLEEAAVQPFQDAVVRAKSVIGLSVRSVKKVVAAEFEFSFEMFSEELADEGKGIFGHLPEGVELVSFEPEEVVHEIQKGRRYAGYAPVRPYVYKGMGHCKGEFGGVVDLFLKCKRSKAASFILTGKIELTLEG